MQALPRDGTPTGIVDSGITIEATMTRRGEHTLLNTQVGLALLHAESKMILSENKQSLFDAIRQLDSAKRDISRMIQLLPLEVAE